MDWERTDNAHICTECLEDEDLRAFMEAIADDDAEGCSFCGAEGDDVVACRFTELMKHIEECIHRDYDLAANNLGWNGQEGGWQGAEHWDTPDLLSDQIGIGFPRDSDGSLLRAMCRYLGYHDWCVQNPYGESPLERMQFDWKEFTEVALHHTRFFLGQHQRKRSRFLYEERSNPVPFLQQVGRCAERLGLVSTLPAGSVLYRVRFEKDGQSYTSAADLGPPPRDGAFVSNRMSPPGIVMFYVAMDQTTAMAETADKAGRYSIGEFRTLKDLTVLDLTKVPEPPGAFAVEPDSREWSRHDAYFFRNFVRDLTKPIQRDNRIHLEYVPTQIVVEYFRRRFHIDYESRALDGVVYPSSRNAGGVASVFFCSRSFVRGVGDEFDFEDTPDQSEKWVELVSVRSEAVN